MISLRGVIRHVSVPKNIADGKPNQAPPSPSSGSPFDPLTTKQGEWVWTGHWAFGSLPPLQDMDRSSAQGDQTALSVSPSVSGAVGSKKRGGGRKRPFVGVRPFMYKFEKIVEAKNVMVPSSFIGESEEDDVEEETGEQQENTQGDVHNGADEGEASQLVDGDDDDDADRLELKKKRDEFYNDGENQLSNQMNETETSKLGKSVDVGHENTSEEKVADIVEKGDDEKKERIVEDIDVTNTAKKSSMEAQQQYPLAMDKASSESASNRAESETNPDKNAQQHVENDCLEMSKDEDSHDSFKTAKLSGSSFAEVEGGTFTDAARASYPDSCPIGGCWKGYFENISVRICILSVALHVVRNYVSHSKLLLSQYNS